MFNSSPRSDANEAASQWEKEEALETLALRSSQQPH
jgi:hypothetical protein